MLGALQRAAAAAAGAAQRGYTLRGLASARGAPGGGLFGISDLQQPGDFLMMLQGTFSRRVPLLPGPRAALPGRRAATSAAATPEPPSGQKRDWSRDGQKDKPLRAQQRLYQRQRQRLLQQPHLGRHRPQGP